ncbi:hypothetical protein [Streptomyces xiamenensis]|uniref:hypothetical protein n=1 Tax=Streptomyces xiamenensis TaxID=408015 RepID=UPI003D715B5E
MTGKAALLKVIRLTSMAGRVWDEYLAGSRLRWVSAPDGTAEWALPDDWTAEEDKALRATALRIAGLMKQIDRKTIEAAFGGGHG